jgi:hypothetical protein
MTKDDRMPNGPAIEDFLVERMRDDLTRPKWWNTLKGRLAIVGVSALVVSTGAAGVPLLQPRAVDDTTIVQCLETASRNLDGTLSGAAAAVATPEGVLEITDALAMCEQMWASGAFSSDDPLDPAPAPGIVPDAFTMCVTDEGSAAVVPGRIECSALALFPVSGEHPD